MQRATDTTEATDDSVVCCSVQNRLNGAQVGAWWLALQCPGAAVAIGGLKSVADKHSQQLHPEAVRRSGIHVGDHHRGPADAAALRLAREDDALFFILHSVRQQSDTLSLGPPRPGCFHDWMPTDDCRLNSHTK